MTEMSANTRPTETPPEEETAQQLSAGPQKGAVRLWQGIFGLILLNLSRLLALRIKATNQHILDLKKPPKTAAA